MMVQAVINILVFLIILGILVFVHELGHFLAARSLGVGVEVFSLGFGRQLFSRKKGGTEYRVSALPFGGYVKMVGEDPADEVTAESLAVSFSQKPVWARMIIVIAGPFSNFLLAVFVFFVFFAARGVPVSTSVIGDVMPDSPAYAAGLLPEDRIISINGEKVAAWEEISPLIQKTGQQPINMVVSRKPPVNVLPAFGLLGAGPYNFVRVMTRGGEKNVSIKIAPRRTDGMNEYGEKRKRYTIGIGPGQSLMVKSGLPKAFTEAAGQTYKVCELTVGTVIRIFRGTVSARETIGGPITMARTTGAITQNLESDFVRTLWTLFSFLGLLSASLGIINVFPIPVLDGGHILFFAIEAIFRRPVNLKVREISTQVGMVFLIALMVFFVVNDVIRWMTGL